MRRKPKYAPAWEIDELLQKFRSKSYTIEDLERAVKILGDALIVCDKAEVEALKATCPR